MNRLKDHTIKGWVFLTLALLFLAGLAFPSGGHTQGKPGAFIPIWYEDRLVTALLIRSAEPGQPNFLALPPVQNKSLDNFYVLTNPNPLQPVTVEITGSIPGDVGYTGGRWNVKLVTFYEGIPPATRPIITSVAGVFDAVALGLATVVDAGVEFVCPVVSNTFPPPNKKGVLE